MLILTSLFYSYTFGQAFTCTGTNRLCIQAANLTSGVIIYYPTSIIPTDINPATISISLYYGPSQVALQNPCQTAETSRFVDSFLITKPFIASPGINGTNSVFHISPEFTDLAKVDNSFFLLLADPNKRQCILGPNIGGKYGTDIMFGN